MDWPFAEGEALKWEGSPKREFSFSAVRHITMPVIWIWGISGAIGLAGWVYLDLPLVAVYVLAVAAFIGVQILGIVWWGARARAKQKYAITNRRIWVHKQGDFYGACAYTLNDPSAVEIEPSGSVAFGYTIEKIYDNGREMDNVMTQRLSLVDDPQHVAALIIEAAKFMSTQPRDESLAGQPTHRLFSEYPTPTPTREE